MLTTSQSTCSSFSENIMSSECFKIFLLALKISYAINHVAQWQVSFGTSENKRPPSPHNDIIYFYIKIALLLADEMTLFISLCGESGLLFSEVHETHLPSSPWLSQEIFKLILKFSLKQHSNRSLQLERIVFPLYSTFFQTSRTAHYQWSIQYFVFKNNRMHT